jgi:signal transduction histidine kinase/CheY-like chemotaxis protein
MGEWHRERRKVYLAIFLACLLPILLLGFFAYRIGSRAVEAQVSSHLRTTAALAQSLVEKEFQGRIRTLEVFTNFPVFQQSVRNRDLPRIRERLRLLVEGITDVNRVSITDTLGRIWVDYPHDPVAIGRDFSHQDWYRGVAEGWRPYISEMFRREIGGRTRTIIIAFPIHLPGDARPVGILVLLSNLERINRLTKQVEAGGGGSVILLDQAGVAVAHPLLDLQAEERAGYRNLALGPGGSGLSEYPDPYSGEQMLATSSECALPGTVWRIIIQQPVSAALRPIRLMALQIGVAAFLLATAMGGILIVSARNHLHVRGLNRELARAKEDLEARVEERTRELREKSDQLVQAQKMEAIGRLAGGIAHDFNNLLTIITGYSERLLKRGGLEDAVQSTLRLILDAGEQAGALTRQLLAFSRKQVLKAESVDLNFLVREMEGMLRRLIGEDIEIVAKLDPATGCLRFDPGQLRQILMNLVINARDAMPQGGRLTIETSRVALGPGAGPLPEGAAAGVHVMLAVSDTGTGMDAPTQARIFEPFFTTKNLGRGTGLGLATVLGIVQQGGGGISVWSEPGKGSVFRIFLPAQEGEGEEGRADGVAPAAGGGQGTVMVVEDEKGVRHLIRETLQGAGYTVLDTADPEEGLRMARDYADPIHLLLTDVVMPGMGGPELARRMRELRPDMKVAYISGYSEEAIANRGMMEGGVALIEKPFKPSDLAARIAGILA